MKFYNFHGHSHYSVLDCVIKIEDYVLECKKRGIETACITDHGSLSSCYELWKVCNDNDIKPALGVEAYFVNSYDDKYAETPYNYGHIVMIAMNETGWNNIKKLQNIAWEKGFFKKPRIQLEDLLIHNEGIIITTGCVDGLIGYWLHKKDLNPDIQEGTAEFIDEKIMSRLKTFQAVFGDRLYGEIQLNDVDIQVPNNKMAMEYCNKLNIPIIVTGDIHYIKQEDSVLHDVVKCVLWRDKIKDPENHTYDTKELWMKKNSELLSAKNRFHNYITNGELKRYINTTETLANRIQKFDILPATRSMPLPDTNGQSSYRCLVDICKNHPDYSKVEKYKVYRQRFQTELRLLMKKQFVDYFLIVNDICEYAKRDKIPFNARGSVCGSLIAYLMNITWIDPIRFKCPFERFLSEDRTSMPDIDLDFSRSGRGMVIKYLQDKYGEECVANICAFSKWKPKVAIKDAARVFDVDFKESNDLTRDIDGGIEWDDLYQDNDVVDFFSKNENIEKYAKKLLGLIRQFSTHASGVLLTAGELTNWCPIAYSKETKITEWDGTMLESLNLLKVDILGVNMLDIVATTIKLIGNHWDGPHALFSDIINKLEDDQVYKFIGTGQTVGTFQLGGSGGMRALAKDMRPNKFNDICAIISLHRTALLIMAMDQEYVKRKRGGTWVPIHPKTAPILQDTYGILLYQSQTTQIAYHLAGFTYVEADAFRKAIKKKDAELMAPWKEQFVTGCKEVSGIEESQAEEIWGFIEAFSEYGFNKCLTSDTEVFRSSKSNSKQRITIGHLYKVKNDLNYCKRLGYISMRKKIQRDGYGKILSLCKDDRIRPKRIKDIHYNGIQTVYTVVLKNGKQITGTANHRLLTDSGYKEIGNLKYDDKIVCDGGYDKKRNYRKRTTEKDGWNKKHYPIKKCGFQQGILNPSYVDGRTVALNDVKKQLEYIKFCEQCGKKIKKFEHHHIDGDHLNNNIKNISKVCNSCHKKLDYKLGLRKGKWTKGHCIEMIGIRSISHKDTREPTYDIEMDDEEHNFIANGIVSHNSHATSYAFLGYVTCWLKYYYPHEYMTSLLKHNIDDTDKLYGYMQECCRMKIPIIKPDINNSTDEFVLRDKKIYCPINFVKGIGEKALPKILDNKPYTGLEDFITRAKVNVGINYSLILSDSFKEICGKPKEEIWSEYRESKLNKDKFKRELYCYDCGYRYPVRIDPKKGVSACPQCEGHRVNIEEEDIKKYEFDENYVNEKTYGFNIWNDSLAKHIPMLEAEGYSRLSELVGDGIVRTVFEVKKVRLHQDKNDNTMAFVEISDNIVHMDLIVFSDMWERKGHTIKKGKLYVGSFKKEGQKLILFNRGNIQPVTIFRKGE